MNVKINQCIDAGFNQCPWCELVSDDGMEEKTNHCWLEYHIDLIRGLSDIQLKEKCIIHIRTHGKLDYYMYYFNAAVKHHYPHKSSIIDKIMILL
jgi:hypothetical protein